MRQPKSERLHILAIGDLSCYGNVALSVMMPMLAHLKCEVSVLPTALVSNPWECGPFALQETTAFMKDAIAHWRALGIRFDAAYVGFVASEAQGEFLRQYCENLRAAGTRICLDPILGDDGKPYASVTERTVAAMRRLCGAADLIVPNVTEASLLTGQPVRSAYTPEETKALMAGLHALGVPSAVITGIPTADRSKRCTAISERAETPCRCLPYREIPVSFPGTGDLFAAVTLCRYLETGDLPASVRAAMRRVERALRRAGTGAPERYRRTGIPTEALLERNDHEKAKNQNHPD